MDEQQQQLVAEFCGITGANPSSAQGALASANWNLQEAVALFYAAQDEPQEQDQDDDLEYDDSARSGPLSAFADPTPAQPTASASSSSSRPNRNPPGQRPKQMTMDELRKRNEQGDDDSEDENKPGQDMFAGGEKSGLAVQNPGQNKPPDHFKNIMNQARQNRDRPEAVGGEPENEPQRSSNFAGRAQTLGGDDAESEVIEDPFAPPAGSGRGQPTERVARTLHLWADGISIDDGPLFRFDDPANQAIMAEIHRGRAPLQLLDVQPNQEVDLNLEPHEGENYVQPKKKYKPFGGSGQRLGSPTPSAPTASAATIAPSVAAAATSTQSSGQIDVDDSQPTVQLRVQLGDGTRLPARFNTTHTIGDVYAFVDRASPESTQRPYALMTTFPPKELDRSAVLGDLSEFKRGGVVVQKWK